MSSNITVYKNIKDLSEQLPLIKKQLEKSSKKYSGICGFDGFVDTFIRMEEPASMAVFGPKVSAAAGIAASYKVRHNGDKFGGNGPLFAGAISDMFKRNIDLTYIGAMGKNDVIPLFKDALEDKVDNMYTLAEPAHSDCLEFTDGKIMLGDLSSCAEITWDKLIEVVGEKNLESKLLKADFISAVNWGKLDHVGEIWKNLSLKLAELQVPPKKVHLFMDLAEFEHRSKEDIQGLMEILPIITKQSSTILSFNLKEAWQMASFLGKDFHGKKEAEDVAQLASFIRKNIDVDKIVIHPNDGAVIAGSDETIYVPGPYCKEPLISTGAGDNFGAGCLSAYLKGLDDLGIILTGVCASGHFVRSGKSASFKEMIVLLKQWLEGTLAERI